MREHLSIDKKQEDQTRPRKVEDLYEIHFETERVNESRPQNIRRNIRKNNTRKSEQDQVTMGDADQNKNAIIH